MPMTIALDDATLRRLEELGGAEFVAEMIDLFLEHAPALIARARETDAVENLEATRRAAHTLVSVAGNLGARELSALAAAIEQAAIRGERETTRNGVAQLQPAFDRARESLNVARAANA